MYIMNNKIIILFCFLFFFSLQAQIFEESDVYPEGQFPYEGGEAQFYRDFHNILIAKNLKPCANKEEMYNLKVIISEDGIIKYLKDDSNNIMAAKNDCTYELGLEVVSYMNRWKPILIDGRKRQSVAHFFIIPNDLFENYKEGYIPTGIAANYNNLPGGVSSFRSEVTKRIDLTGYEWNKAFQMLITFVINLEGEMEDFQVLKSSGLSEFDQRVINGIKSIKGKKYKWKPGTINGFPVKYRFKLPLTFGAPK